MKTGSFFNKLMENEASPISFASKMLGHVSFNHKVPEVDVFYDIQLILDSDKSLSEKIRLLHGIRTFYKKQGQQSLKRPTPDDRLLTPTPGKTFSADPIYRFPLIG